MSLMSIAAEFYLKKDIATYRNVHLRSYIANQATQPPDSTT